jgi:circadian clock protein KaiC
MLRYTEADAEMHRLISVIKVRECAHDMRAYEFKITERGIVIEDSHASASVVLGRRGKGDV